MTDEERARDDADELADCILICDLRGDEARQYIAGFIAEVRAEARAEAYEVAAKKLEERAAKYEKAANRDRGECTWLRLAQRNNYHEAAVAHEEAADMIRDMSTMERTGKERGE